MAFPFFRKSALALAAVTLVTASCGRLKQQAASGQTEPAGTPSRGEGLGTRLSNFLSPARSVEIPAGSPLAVTLTRPVSSATAQDGDRIEATLGRPLVVDGKTVVPAGSRVEGRVVHAVSSGRLARTASLELELTSLTTPGGETVSLRTSRLTRQGKEHAPRNAGIIGGGAAVGALLGQAFGRNSRSTLEGAAAGAAAGTGVAAATGDLDFTLGAGHELSFRLEEPVTVRVLRS